MVLHAGVNGFTCRGKWFYIERENSGKYNLLVISVTEAVAQVDVFRIKLKILPIRIWQTGSIPTN